MSATPPLTWMPKSRPFAEAPQYTDVEHGIAIEDPDGDWVRRYRGRLWEHHLLPGGML